MFFLPGLLPPLKICPEVVMEETTPPICGGKPSRQALVLHLWA